MGFLDKITGGLGSVAEGVFDALGFPEGVGDIASGVVNAATGNWLGLAQDVVDVAPNLKEAAKGFFQTEPEAPSRQGQAGAGAGAGGAGFGGGELEGPLGGGGDRFAKLEEMAAGDPNKLFQLEMMKQQESMQMWHSAITLQSQLAQAKHETNKALQQNLRV